ncbi:uncharacterized protein LOC124644379 [Helicoverpa zea]|uniref:uncharacterized protein LOC124644379 n=1 Tax=Helicoverpa zea TaxID=7113 RepID=UPI001F57D59E|nr:uncharacterized protein LOC124644379 [Helicoverpa zea]
MTGNQTTTEKPKLVKIVPESVISPKRDNPNFIRDRYRNIIKKPEMPPTWKNRFRQKYDPAWMDYCDPYHCNDYHKIACGLNRRNMKFKWFQSVCHLILNNQCSDFRGFLKYDLIADRFCRAYVMFLRAGCPLASECDDELDPVCAMSSKRGHIVLFKNQCYMDAVNCQNETLTEYEPVFMDYCKQPLLDSIKTKIIES